MIFAPAGTALAKILRKATEIMYHKELQPDKVAYSLRVGSKSEADELLDYLVKNT